MPSRSRRFSIPLRAALAIAAVALPGHVIAQPGQPLPPIPLIPSLLPAAPPLDHLGGTREEWAGWDAIEDGKFIQAREIGDKLLKANPDSFVGHYILGAAFEHGEGDMARAEYHLQLAMKLYEQRFPIDAALLGLAAQGEAAPWRWHSSTLRELSTTLGAIDRPADQLLIIDKHNKLYSPPMLAHKIWPLMKLHRYDDSRAAAKAAIEADMLGSRKHARADLCGAESEAGDRQRAYEACAEATIDFRSTPGAGQLEFSNASEAALEVFKFDEAERFATEAMRRPNNVLWVNPFLQAAEIFLTEGRIPEAIEAMRGGQELRIARPAWVDQFDRARFDATLAKLFMIAGINDRAVAAAQRSNDQPDRQGHASGTEVQAEAASAVVLAVSLREKAEREAEDAVTSSLWASLKLRLRAAWDRLEAWRATRSAAVSLADEEFLVRSLRPYYLGIQLPPWLLPEVIDAVGGGVGLAGIERARALDKHPGVARYLNALEAEAQYRRGDLKAAEGAAQVALVDLPTAEVLLKARLDVILGECARDRGDRNEMSNHFLRALQHDPGLFRRMGVSLPVSVETDGSHLGTLAAKLVARSPRFEDGEGPLRVNITGGHRARICLEGPQREQIACASINLPDDVSDKVGSRLLVEEFHKSAFAVKTDLSQSDLTTLDGSPTAGRADRQIESVLDKLGDGNK